MINIEKALTVPGFMMPVELEYLAEQASQHQFVVELGSFRGRSARAIADNLPENGTLFCVDPWVPEDPSLPLSKAFAAEMEGKPEDFIWMDFHNNMTGLRNYISWRMTSVEAASKFSYTQTKFGCNGNDKFDMIFIDASHTYVDVLQDIKLFIPLMAPGALMCGHDYDPVYWPGVVKAVNEVFPEARAVAGTIWAVTL